MMATTEMHPDMIERLETKIAFLEHANQELSDAVYAAQQQIDALREQVRLLAQRLASAAEQQRPYTLEEEQPPHY